MDSKDNVNNTPAKCPNCEDFKGLASIALELLTYALDPARTPFELMTIRMQVSEMLQTLNQSQTPPSDCSPDNRKTGT